MKITVITGSPRKDGNTFSMVDAFIKAAESKGHEVTRFDAAMMKIGGHACMTCFTPYHPSAIFPGAFISHKKKYMQVIENV